MGKSGSSVSPVVAVIVIVVVVLIVGFFVVRKAGPSGDNKVNDVIMAGAAKSGAANTGAAHHP